jgi:ABC-type multidrug transport system ATPase subunit
MTVVYRLESLTKVYRRTNVTANDALSLEIKEGEIFGLLGPSGAGKTTLVRQIAGLLKPTSGKISLYGNDIARNASLVPRFVAMQPQDAFSLASLKVRLGSPDEAKEYA